jgi:TPR repeat protein
MAMESHQASTPAQREVMYHLHLTACEEGQETSCERLGFAHAYGPGPNLDPTRTQAALVEGCTRGNPSACYIAGASLQEGRLDTPEEMASSASFPLFERGCVLDDARSCAWAGLKLWFGRGVPEDQAGALPYYDKACTLGEAHVGCFNVAMHAMEAPEQERDLAQILDLFTRACAAGNDAGCDNTQVVADLIKAAEDDLTPPPEATGGDPSNKGEKLKDGVPEK